VTAPLKTTAATIARQNHIPVPLFLALIGRESGWNPNARSPAGAIGLGQLMPATARGLGVNDPANPEENLAGAARYLAQQLAAFHTPALALAAYNAGPGAVHQYHGVPPFPETQAYVRNVLGDAQQLGGSAPPPVQRQAQPGAPAATPSPAGTPAPGAQQILAAALLKASRSGQYGGFFNTLASLRQQPPQQAPTAPLTPVGPTRQPQPQPRPVPQQTAPQGPAPRLPALVHIQSDSTVTGVDKHLLRAVGELATYLGKPITITSGYRSYAEQEALYQRYLAGGNIAAKPGQSNHERGEALDLTVNGVPIALAVPASVLARFGLHNPVRGDYPHTTLLSVNG
jgi:hypothetical protein